MKQNDRDDGDDRDTPSPGWEERIEAAYLRIKAGLPPVPWLPNLPTLTGVRRQVRRARAGVIVPGNPQIPAQAWADTLEQGIVMNVVEREALRKQIEEDKRQEAGTSNGCSSTTAGGWRSTGSSSECPKPPTRTARSARRSWP